MKNSLFLLRVSNFCLFLLIICNQYLHFGWKYVLKKRFLAANWMRVKLKCADDMRFSL